MKHGYPYAPPVPVKATLEGGDFDGKTITLPVAFRGLDIEKGDKAARYRYAARKPDGSYTYAHTSPRRRLHKGALVFSPGEDLKVMGLLFYPSESKAPKGPA